MKRTIPLTPREQEEKDYFLALEKQCGHEYAIEQYSMLVVFLNKRCKEYREQIKILSSTNTDILH